MKIEEAINNLKHGKCIPYKHETLNMAIKSLEAWSKVIKEINESFINNDLDFGEETHYNSALVDVLEIIDKHLSGVSE